MIWAEHGAFRLDEDECPPWPIAVSPCASLEGHALPFGAFAERSTPVEPATRNESRDCRWPISAISEPRTVEVPPYSHPTRYQFAQGELKLISIACRS